MRCSTGLLALGLLIGTAAGAQDTATRMPMQPGNQPRPINWNSDGAPKPPPMWMGHGESWPKHFKACRDAHGKRYNARTDMVMQNGRRTRCSR